MRNLQLGVIQRNQPCSKRSFAAMSDEILLLFRALAPHPDCSARSPWQWSCQESPQLSLASEPSKRQRVLSGQVRLALLLQLTLCILARQPRSTPAALPHPMLNRSCNLQNAREDSNKGAILSDGKISSGTYSRSRSPTNFANATYILSSAAARYAFVTLAGQAFE